MATRREIRQQRYNYFRSLGYEAREARRLRDQGSARTDARILSDVERLQSRPQLSREESERLERLRSARRERTPTPIPEESRDVESPRETQSRRRRNFQRWSQRNVGFPTDVLRRVQSINTSAGLDIHSSYGYRVFYHRYVNGESPVEAQLRAERRDT